MVQAVRLAGVLTAKPRRAEVDKQMVELAARVQAKKNEAADKFVHLSEQAQLQAALRTRGIRRQRASRNR